MGSVRNHIRVASAPDAVWKVVSDAGAIAAWAPDVERSSASGNMRHVEFTDGVALEEAIVTSDDELRRFQYRVVAFRVEGPDGVIEGPNPVDTFATVDVIEDQDGAGALVIYSTEIISVDEPGGDAERNIVDLVKVRSAGFLRGLKEYVER